MFLSSALSSFAPKAMSKSSFQLTPEAMREDEFKDDRSKEDMEFEEEASKEVPSEPPLGKKATGSVREKSNIVEDDASSECDGVRDKKEREIEEFMSFFGSERLVFFSDAVIAISLTLLILPLMEGVQSASKAHISAYDYFSENGQLLLAFLLSFFIINQYWRVHEGLFQYVRKYSEAIRRLNAFFLLLIVFLPVNTASVNQLDNDDGAVFAHVLYVGNLLLIDIILILMNVFVRRDPRLWSAEHTPPTSLGLLVLSVAFLILCVTLVLVFFVPNPQVLNMLFSLALVNPLVRFLHHRSDIVQRYGNFIDGLIGAEPST